jgi:hypothetical protein
MIASARRIDEEKILNIFRQARASEKELELVRKCLARLRANQMTPEEAYYYFIGLAREFLIPLTPRQVQELREALGLPPSLSS